MKGGRGQSITCHLCFLGDVLPSVVLYDSNACVPLVDDWRKHRCDD